jgi:hypothetical protein
MGERFYIGVGDKARTASYTYVGVEGKARKVRRMYIGDEDGIARLLKCDHDYSTSYKNETCTEDGWYSGSCACGDSFYYHYDALGHDITTEGTPNTCTEDGLFIKKCTRCDYKEETVTKAYGHTYVETGVAKDPTCGKDGYVRKKCRNCGAYYDEIIPATGNHSWEYYYDNDENLRKYCTVCHEDTSA